VRGYGLEAMGSFFRVLFPEGRYDSITVLSPPLEGGMIPQHFLHLPWKEE